MISDNIVAINLDCINQEDPTNAKCNDGWAFRKLNSDTNEFVKHDTLSFNCIGNIYTIDIPQLLKLYCQATGYSYYLINTIFFYILDYAYRKHWNNPCQDSNNDIWTFERQFNQYGGIKEYTAFRAKYGCCAKLAPFLKRDRLNFIMNIMKYSLNTPMQEDLQTLTYKNKSFNEFPILLPTEDLIQKLEKK